MFLKSWVPVQQLQSSHRVISGHRWQIPQTVQAYYSLHVVKFHSALRQASLSYPSRFRGNRNMKSRWLVRLDFAGVLGLSELKLIVKHRWKNQSFTLSCLSALSHSFCPGAVVVQCVIRLLMLSVTALAAAASWFFAFGAPGSAESAFAARRSLLEDIETVFKLLITWFWSSLS